MKKLILILTIFISLNTYSRDRVRNEKIVTGSLMVVYVGSIVATGGTTAIGGFIVLISVRTYYKVMQKDKFSGYYSTRKQNRFKNKLIN